MGELVGLPEAAELHLLPVLEHRGFRLQSAEANAVLFHCDGDELDPTVDRFRGWRERLERSYGDQSLICLDLWVTREESRLGWSFEVFEPDVEAAAGPVAMARLRDLEGGDAAPYVEQLALVLDAYFRTVE